MVEILNEVLNQIFRAHITKFCHKYLLIILIFIRALPYLPVCPNHILQRLVKKTSTLPTTHPPTLSGAFDQLCAAQWLSCYLWRPAPWENTFDLFLIGHVLSLARARVRAHALDLELKVLTCHVHLYTVKFTRKDKRCAGALLGDGFEELATNKHSGDGRGRQTDRLTDWRTDRQRAQVYFPCGPIYVTDDWGPVRATRELWPSCWNSCVTCRRKPALHAISSLPPRLPSDINLSLVLSPPYGTTTKWRLSTMADSADEWPIHSSLSSLVLSSVSTARFTSVESGRNKAKPILRWERRF